MNYSLDYISDGTVPYIFFIPKDIGIWDAPFAGPVTYVHHVLLCLREQSMSTVSYRGFVVNSHFATH